MSVSSVPSGAASGRKWPGKRAGRLKPSAVVVVESGELQAAASRRIKGLYSADEVRALPGDLVSIESTLLAGRFLCAWLEWPADDKRRLDGAKNGDEL